MDSEEETIKVISATTSNDRVKMNENCKVCQASLPKYTCPRCMVKTCSLQCVKDHKARTGCTGIRDKTAYVPIKEFTERNLLSDYRFLEDADRKCYSATVDELNKPSFQKKFKKQKIEKECYKRGVTLKLLPHQFSKHRENSTIFATKTKLLLWHVKWIFVHADAEFANRRLRETITLREALNTYLDPSVADPIIRHRLKKYSADLDDIRVLLKVENRPANSVRYHLLKLDQTLRDNLAGKTILEYPTLHVVLQKQAQHYTLLHQDEAESVTNGKIEEVHSMPLTLRDKEVQSNTAQEHLPVSTELQPIDIAEGDNQDLSMEQNEPVDISVDPAIGVAVETNDSLRVDGSLVTEVEELENNTAQEQLHEPTDVDVSVDPATENVVIVNGDEVACSKEQDMAVNVSEDPAREMDVSMDLVRDTDPKQQPIQNIGKDDHPSIRSYNKEYPKVNDVALEDSVYQVLST